MIKHILSNWKTTAVAIVIFVVAMAMVFTDKATLSQVGPYLGTVFALLFVSDGDKK